MFPVALLLLQVGVGGAQRHDLGTEASATVERVAGAILQFLADWKEVWYASEAQRHPISGSRDTRYAEAQRSLYMRCPPTTLSGVPPLVSEIFSVAPQVSVCPTWVFDDTGAPGNERKRIDDAIAPSFAAEIATRRRALIAEIQNAVHALPRDSAVIGQLVRFQVEAGDLDRALQTARNCLARAPWCAMLAGYVYARSGSVAQADSAFRDALGGLDPVARCVLSDLSLLLDRAAQEYYRRRSCEERERLNEVIWWIARPLLSEEGNARRVEHYLRLATLAFRDPWSADERWDFRTRAGGDAKKEMITRYGWPSRVYWGGWLEDLIVHRRSSYGLLNTAWTGSPRTTFEYDWGRLHLFPTRDRLTDPLSASVKDLSVEQPNQRALDDRDWWPREHFQPSVPIVQIPDGQFALLRRDTTTLVAFASEFPQDVVIPMSRLGTVGLFVSSFPDVVTRIGGVEAASNDAIRVSGEMSGDSGFVGVEFPGASGNPAGRWRSTIRNAPTLANLANGELAVSEPIILTPRDDGAFPASTDDALATMAPTTTFSRRGTLTVYWESYGARTADSLEIAVWMERITPHGILERIAVALGTRPDVNTPVVTTWLEPRAGPGAVVMAGMSTTVGRTITLDVSGLVEGAYSLSVSIARPGQPAVRGHRVITLR